MGEYKKDGQSAAEPVVMKPKRRVLVSKRFALIASLVVAVVLIGVLASAATVWLGGRSSTASKKKLTPQQAINQAVNKTVEHPDLNAGQTALEHQLQAATSSTGKADIYSQLASVAEQKQDYQTAINDYQQAVKYDPKRSGLLSNSIADAYYQLKQKPQALQYYQQALAYYQSQPDSYSGKAFYIQSVQARIAELQ